MSNIYFTLDEASRLIPWLNQLFNSIEPIQKRIEKLSEQMLTLKHKISSNGGSSRENELHYCQSQIKEDTKKIESQVRSVQERGIIVRSISQGLVDFPHKFEDRDVYLCWIHGESKIEFFHETNTGYTDRMAL